MEYSSHLILCDEFALPVCVGHVVDWQSQIVRAVFKVQGLWFIQKLPSHLDLHLKNLLHKITQKTQCLQNISSTFLLSCSLNDMLSPSIRDCRKLLFCLVKRQSMLNVAFKSTATWNTGTFLLDYHNRPQHSSANCTQLQTDIKMQNKNLDY